MAANANEQLAPPVMTYDQYMENLRSLVLNEDVRRVVAAASDEDKVALATSIIEEAIAYQDYEMARSMVSDDATSQIDLLSRLFEQLDASSTVPHQASGRGTGESSSSRHRSQNTDPGKATDTSYQQTSDSSIRRECTACRESVAVLDLTAAPCGHDYCKDCIRHLFTSAIGDDELFPPRCCRQAIPISSVGSILSRDEQQIFMEKLVEFNTLDKPYCSQPSCSTFIPSNNIANVVARCPKCGTRTCTVCKSKAHAGRDCPKDTGVQEVLNMAVEQGWQRC